MAEQHRRILIAEDDYVSQKLAYKFIQDMGHIPFVSPDGDHAYNALKACNEFDLLMTDIMMPRMNGRQLIQTIKGDSQLMELPVIIMSAVIGIRDISDLLKLGASLFLAKPLKKTDLEEAVQRSLGLAANNGAKDG